MQKEIYEQPIVVAQTLRSYLRPLERAGRAARSWTSIFADVKRVTIVACGTSFYAGMVAKYWFEQFARVPVDLDVASRVPLPRSRCWSRAGWRCSSRNRARPPTRSPRCATPRAEGQTIAVVVNVPTSSMAREADLLLPTHAGPGDRRRLDQGVHLPARGARRARRQARARQGPAEPRRRSARSSRHLARGAGRDERGARP